MNWKEILIVSGIILLAAALNASMDTIEYHYGNSIFTQFGSYFQHDWTRVYERDPATGELIQPLTRKQWNFGIFKMNIHPMFFDAWHLFKTFFLCLFILLLSWKDGDRWWKIGIRFVVFAVVWNLSFNLLFDRLLII